MKINEKNANSFDYGDLFDEPSRLVKLSIFLNDVEIEELTQIVHETRIEFYARRLVERIKEEMPRKQFRIALQARVGRRIVARETIKEYSKNYNLLNAKGDKSRKTKLIKEQAEFKRLIRDAAKKSVSKNLLINILKTD